MREDELKTSMRQIKFRWWVKEPSHPRGGYMNGTFEGEWWLGIEANSGLLVNVVNGKVEDAPDGKIVLMQFTGLLDKNGKEIYEGNIVKFHHAGKEIIRAVEWSDVRMGWTEIYKNPLDISIIGNIHENPELLK